MRVLVTVLCICVLALTPLEPAEAVDLRAGQSVIYPVDAPTNGDIMAAGRQVIIRSQVKGDVTVAGGTVVVAGPVNNSLLAVGGSVAVSGPVGNDVWLAGHTVALTSSVADNAYLGGYNVTVGENALIGTDLLAMGSTLTIMGHIRRNARIVGSDVMIAAKIDGNAYVKSDDAIRIVAGTVIKGNLFCESPKRVLISKNAIVLGKVRHRIPAKEKVKPVFWSGMAFSLGSFAAELIFGLLLLLAFPHRIRLAAGAVRDSFWISLGVGAVALVATPAACVAAGATLVGIPAALAVAAVYLILLYAGAIVVAVALGQIILGWRRESPPGPAVSMVVGLLIISLAGMLPFLGGLVKFAATLSGFGAFLTGWWHSRGIRIVG